MNNYTKVVCVFVVLSLFAVPGYAQLHADEATYDPDMDVHEMTVWERIGAAVSKLEIGAYNSAGAFSTSYFVGDTVVLKFDETSWNVQCANGAKFVIEVYSPKDFIGAKYDWVGPVSGNKHFAGTVSYVLPNSPNGLYTFVDYLYCVDPQSNMYLKSISSANKISVLVSDKQPAQTCTAKYIGESVCSDGDVKRLYRNTDCTSALKLVTDCTSTQFCMDAKCNDPECSSNAQCESWQQCVSGECVAKPGCTTDSQCGSGMKCVSGACVASGCTSDSQCGSGKKCVSGSCVASGCTSDSQCSSGMKCVSGSCVASGCTSDSQCASGEECVSGQCVAGFEYRKLIMPGVFVVVGMIATYFGVLIVGIPAFIVGAIWLLAVML